MADFLLSVGVDVDLSYDQMQRDISALVSQLNGNPPTIKVGLDFDRATITQLRTQLAEMHGSIGNTGSGAVSNVVTNFTNEMKEAAAAVSTANTNLNTTEAKLSIVKASLTEIQRTNATINTEYKNLKNTLGGEAATGQNASDISQLKQKYIEYQAAIEQTRTAKATATQEDIQNIYRLQAEMQNLMGSIRERMTLETESSQAAQIAAQAKIESERRATAESQKRNEREKKEESEQQQLLTRSYTLLQQMRAAEQNWTMAKKGKSSSNYESIQKDTISLDELITKYKAGGITIEKFKNQLVSLNSGFKINSSVIKQNSENTQTFSERIGGLTAKFSTWFSITRIMMAAYQSVRKMVSSIIELDTAMTELRKVTDETEAAYEKFFNNATVRAKKFGASLSDTITASADFARLGYGIEDAEKLADAAIVYKNVGDGITDISNASESIIATMQAFGVSAEDVMLIVDKFNEVGNNYAISSKGVGDALLRSAAAMHAANNSLDETIALATAANTVVQDPEKVGTTLKTVSMFLRAAKTEAEDAGESTDGMASSVSKLRGEFLSLTGNKVDIQIDEDTFKSTYQILKELSEIWEELTDVSQANILEMVGGKRNSNVVSALLENFSIAEESLQTAAESAGSALSENEKALASIQGKLNVLKASFEALSAAVIDSGFFKSLIDGATAILDLITFIADKLGTFPMLLAAITGVMSARNMAKGNMAGFFSPTDEKKIGILGISLSNLAANFNAAKTAGLGFGGSLKASVTPNVSQTITAIERYNSLSTKSASFQAKYNDTLIKSDTAMAKYLRSLNGGQASLKGYNAYCKSAGIQTDALGVKAKLAALKVGLLSVAMNMFLSMAIGLLIQGVVAAFDALAHAASRASEAANETAKNTKEAADANLEEAHSLNELINKYIKLKENEFTDASKRNEIRGIQEEIVKLVGSEAGGIDLVNGKLDDTLEKLREKQKLQAIEAQNSAKAAYNAAVAAESAATPIDGKWEDYRSNIVQNKAEIAAKNSLKKAGFGDNIGMGDGQKYLESLIPLSNQEYDLVIYANKTRDGEIAQGAAMKAQAIKEMIDVLRAAGHTETDIFTGLQLQYEAYMEYTKKTADAAKMLLDATYAVEQHSDLVKNKTVDSVESYDTYKKALTEAIKGNEMFKSALSDGNIQESDISLYVDDIMAAKFPEYYNEIAEASKGAGAGTGSFSTSLSELSDSLGNLKSSYDLLETAQKEMLDGGLSADTIKALADATEDYINYLYEENGVIKLNVDAWKEYANLDMGDKVKKINAERSELEEERNEIEKNIEALNNATIVADNYRGIPIKGAMSQSEWNAAMERQTKLLNSNTAALEINQNKLGVYGSLYEDIIGGFNAYSTALQSFENVSDIITSVSDSLTTVADLQETVANGFTLSLDKALEFAAVYPEILNGATMAADGQISLNEGVVNAFIEGKEAELHAQIDTKIAELQSNKATLQAKMEFSKAQLELAKKVGEGEGQITKEVAEYRLNTGNQLAEALIAAGIDEATAYQLACEAMSGNYTEFNDIAAAVCTDINGNMNKAAYSAAQTIYTNMNSAKTDVASLATQAHETATAIKNMADGIVAGRSGVVGGSGGGFGGGKASISVTAGTFNGVDYTYAPRKVTLDKFISDLELDISSYTQAMSHIDGQIAALQTLRNTNLDKFSTSNKATSKSSSGSGSGSDSGSSSKEESWFEKQYRLHNHLLNMDAENVEDYLNWLNSAYQKAYKEGIIDLDNFYKYQEEVYKGLRDLFKDYLNDIEHEISMRENYSGESKKIISLYKEMIAAVEKEIKAARKQGLDDTDDYIQELQSKWQSYSKSIKEIQDDISGNAKDAIKELVDIRIDMLKQDIENEKDAIKKKLNYLKEFYQKQKDMLQDAYDEEKYYEEQSEKRKAITDLQAELNQLEYDDSAWAQKRKLELAKELADAQKDLNSFEKDHALEMAQEQLDSLYEMQEKELDAQTELLEEKQNDAKALYDQALADIKSGSIALYEEMVAWNQTYGDGIDDTIKTAWENAYAALQDYYDLYGKYYESVKLANATGYVKESDSWNNSVISGTNSANKTTTAASSSSTTKTSSATTTTTTKPSLTTGSYVQVKSGTKWYADSYGGGSYGTASAGKIKYINTQGTHAYNIDGLGWVKKTDIVGYAKGTRNAAAGLHGIDELGEETIFESADGSRYKMFSGGEKVLNAKASNFLYDFANGKGEILANIIKGAFGNRLFDNIRSSSVHNEITWGDIIVQGSADMKTVSEIRRAQRESLTDMLKSLNKLSK